MKMKTRFIAATTAGMLALLLQHGVVAAPTLGPVASGTVWGDPYPVVSAGIDPSTGKVYTLKVDATGQLYIANPGGGGGGGGSTSTTTYPASPPANAPGTTGVTLYSNATGDLRTFLTNTSLGVTGTFWQSTQPISAASLPLPTGAATSAKQPALGAAGTPSTDVITIQGITAGTPVRVISTSYPALYSYALASLATSTLVGYYVDVNGLQVGSVKTYNLTTTTTTFTTLETTIPAGAVGFACALTGSNLYVNRSGQVGGTATYAAASGPQITSPSLYLTFGGVFPL